MTHVVIDGIHTNSTEPTNPGVLAFHEGFVDLCALFAHFSHKEALTDAPAGVSIRPTWRRLPADLVQFDALRARRGNVHLWLSIYSPVRSGWNEWEIESNQATLR